LPPDFVYFDIRVAWSEVEKVERVKMLGMPFSGEAARVTVSGSPAMDGTRAFLFFTFWRRRTLKVLDIAESSGAPVEQKARIKFTQP
jgi:hypothetical protein